MPNSSNTSTRLGSLALRWIAHGVALFLSAFHCFVGYHKAFSPLAELTKHAAWTIHVPEPIGRLVGWSEMAFCLTLIAPLLSKAAQPSRRVACYFFILLEMLAAIVHAAHGEIALVPQNGVMIALCLFILWSDRRAKLMRAPSFARYRSQCARASHPLARTRR